MADQHLLDNRYQVLETIAERPGSSVRKALDTRLGATVVLKTLAVDDPVARDDLVAEARTLQLLEPHPNLPRLRNDFDLDDGSCVIVIDWVDGEDLDTKLEKSGRPGLLHSSVADWIGQVADALDHLHQQDPPIVHGDVKPSNIVLTRTNKVVLLDFGIARIAGQTSNAGTLGFMAPEVAADEPVTPATDVYGLAATAYALLTGVPPGPGQLDIPDVDSSALAAVQQVLQHGLAVDPARRYSTAGDFAARLRAGNKIPPASDLTLLGTEIVDFDELWDQYPDLMDEIAPRVTSLVSIAVDEADGHVFDAGDEQMLSWFLSASASLRAALTIRSRLAEDRWLREHNVRLRTALHTGEPELINGRPRGKLVRRVQRLRQEAEPGQILVSFTTAPLLSDRMPIGIDLTEISLVSGPEASTNGGPAYAVDTGELLPLAVPTSTPTVDVPVVPPPSSAPPPRRTTSKALARLIRERDDVDAEVTRMLLKQDEAQRAGQPGLAAKFEQGAGELTKRLTELRREIERFEAQESSGATG